jgi:hypothetical protein
MAWSRPDNTFQARPSRHSLHVASSFFSWFDLVSAQFKPRGPHHHRGSNDVTFTQTVRSSTCAHIFFLPHSSPSFSLYKSFNKRKKYKFFAGRNFYVGFAYKSFVSKNFYIGFALYFRANDGNVDIPYIL